MTGPGKRVISSWLVALAGIIALAAHLAASAHYSNWVWGFDHYFFLRREFAWMLMGLGSILCLPPVWSRAARPQRSFRRADIAIAGIAAVVFWLLRTPYHFLGDGRLMIRLLDQGKWFHASEPLDRLVHYGVLLVTRPLLGWDAALVYAAVSVAGGFAYVMAALRLGTILKQRLFVTASLLTLGTVELFMGYAESYTLATAAILVYVVVAIEYLLGNRRLVWTGVTLAAGIALHNALLFLVPSFLYLAIAGRDKDPMPRSRRIATAAVALALALAVVAASTLRQRSALMLLPLAGAPDAQYMLFSVKHLVDFLNEQVLISPLAWIGMAVFIYAFAKDPGLRKSRRYRFLMLAAAFPLLFNFVIRPDLGGSRDWDMWSMGSLPYVVTVVCAIASGLGRRADLKAAACTLVVVGCFHVIPWVAVNHSPQLSLDNFGRMLDRNSLWAPQRTAAASSELGHFYYEQGAYEGAAVYLQRAADLAPKTARYWDALGVALVGMERYADAVAPIRRAIELDPGDGSAYNNLGRVYQALGRFDEAEAALKRSIELAPESGTTYFNLSRVYLAEGKPDEAMGAARRAVELMPFVPEYWSSLAKMLEAAGGREREALDAWNRVVTLADRDPSQRKAVQAALDHIQKIKAQLRN